MVLCYKNCKSTKNELSSANRVLTVVSRVVTSLSLFTISALTTQFPSPFGRLGIIMGIHPPTPYQNENDGNRKQRTFINFGQRPSTRTNYGKNKNRTDTSLGHNFSENTPSWLKFLQKLPFSIIKHH